jgi:membrane protease subunit (stomatin/prohibitin family)
MGILGFIKSQLIDIIEWMDNSNYTLVHRSRTRTTRSRTGPS